MAERTPDAGKDAPDHPPRLLLLWKLLVFQGKLIVDGVRDLVLSPVSIIAVAMGFLFGGDHPERYFRRVLHLGRRSDVWINLFNTYRRGQTSDQLINPIEQRLMEEYQRGGWLTKAGQGMDRAFDNVNDLQRKARENPAGRRTPDDVTPPSDVSSTAALTPDPSKPD